jgi:hypothetical protein
MDSSHHPPDCLQQEFGCTTHDTTVEHNQVGVENTNDVRHGHAQHLKTIVDQHAGLWITSIESVEHVARVAFVR